MSTADLTRGQNTAVAHVRERALARREHARSRISGTLGRAVSPDAVDALLHGVRDGAIVTINFHPDRLLLDGRCIAEAMLHDRRYKNQFETEITSASPTAFRGGERDLWEEEMFGRAYHDPLAPVEQRPKYGGLNLFANADGAAPRFGSCHLQLAPHVLAQTTFSFGDSYLAPADVGTVDALDSIVAALLETVDATGCCLGHFPTTVVSVVTLLGSGRDGLRRRGARGQGLEEYIEAQVHGQVDLSSDVDRVVCDPSFRDTRVGGVLREIARASGVPLAWHDGFELTAADVPADVRGPRMPVVAARVLDVSPSRDGLIDAAAIGRAAARVATQGPSWLDVRTTAEAMQLLHYLWHVVVMLGAPRPAGPSAAGDDR